MSEPTTNMAEGAAPQEKPTELSTHSDEFALLAAKLEPNEDNFVSTKDPLYDGQTVLATIESVELGTVAEGKGRTVEIAWKLEEPLKTTDEQPITRSPGFVYKPRFAPIIEADTKENEDKARMGREEVARAMEAVGLIPKGGAKFSKVLLALGQARGKQAKLKFKVAQGKKRDPETGELQKFQRVYYSKPDEAGGNGAVEAGSSAEAPASAFS